MITLPLFQATVLTAVRQLPEDQRYGYRIWERVCKLSAHEYSDGAVYLALQRLMKLGYVYTKSGERTIYCSTFEGRCAHTHFMMRIRRLLDD